jgi:general secretion pathway protein C
MLNILHSFYRPTCLALCLLLGLACGHLADTVLQMQLRSVVPVVVVPKPSEERTSPKIATADLNLILQNNIFDADNRSADATINRSPVSAGNDNPAATTRADLKLFGTVVAGELSQALLEVNKELKIYHLGDKIAGSGTLEEVLRNQVKIKNRDQSLTTLILYEQAPKAAGGETASSPAANKVNGKPANNVGDVDIREVGENRWMISQSTIESVRENFAAQLRLAQMQPRIVAGKTDGFLIQRINPRSLLAKLGLQRGDVVIDVNNIKLDSPEKALQIFQQLREARQISLAV